MKHSAKTVLSALRSGPFPEPSHAWLYEVRNATGNDVKTDTRYADALIVSCWPSRGIWFAGVEVKVSRRDWKNELKNPEKSTAIQDFCDYWWIAAPPLVIEPSEIPEAWGLLEVQGDRVKTIKEAPKLLAKPLAQGFVASILRNQAANTERRLERSRIKGWEQRDKELGSEALYKLNAKLTQIELELGQAQRDHESSQQEIARLRAIVATFEREAGLPAQSILNARYTAQSVGRYYQAAQVLSQLSPDDLAERLSAAALALRRLPIEPG